MAPMKGAAAALLLLLCSSIVMVKAQPACRTYKRLFTSSDASAVMDTIYIPDSYGVASVSVSDISVAHPRVGALQVSLLHQLPGSAPAAAVVLKAPRSGSVGMNLAATGFADDAAGEFPTAEAAPFTGTYKPAQPLSAFAGQDASGSWVLRIADVTYGGSAPKPLITLTGWALHICPGTAPVAVAADGPADNPLPALPPLPEAPQLNVSSVDVSLNGSGLNVSVGGNGTTGGFRLGVSSYSGAAGAGEDNTFADALLNLLFPFRPALDDEEVQAASGSWQAGPVLAAAGMAKEAAQGVVQNQVADAATYVTRKSDVFKDFLNKKISDYINAVNSASALTQQLIKSGGAQLGSHALRLNRQAMDLKGAVTGLQGAAKQEVLDKVNHLLSLTNKLTSMSGALVGDMGSTATLIKDAALVKAKALVDTYTTTEGLVKAHIDTSVQKKAGALNAVLERIIAAADSTAAQGGPVIDWKAQATKTKMQALEAAVDHVAAAVKAMPTPSQAVQGAVAAKGVLLSSTRIGKAITDPEAAIAQLMGNVGRFKDLMTSKFGYLG